MSEEIIRSLQEQVQVTTDHLRRIDAERAEVFAKRARLLHAIAALQGKDVRRSNGGSTRTGNGSTWTPDRVDRARVLVSQGKRYREIADELGVTEKSVKNAAWAYQFGKRVSGQSTRN